MLAILRFDVIFICSRGFLKFQFVAFFQNKKVALEVTLGSCGRFQSIQKNCPFMVKLMSRLIVNRTKIKFEGGDLSRKNEVAGFNLKIFFKFIKFFSFKIHFLPFLSSKFDKKFKKIHFSSNFLKFQQSKNFIKKRKIFLTFQFFENYSKCRDIFNFLGFRIVKKF